MSDVQRLLEKQAQWQKARKALSWPEKIRMAERIRESAIRLRATGRRELRRRPPAPP
jgi:hypothetical protein